MSAAEATEHYLSRIDVLNPKYGAFVSTQAELACEEAAALDRERAAHPARPLPALWGLPLAHKDLVAVAGAPTTYGSLAFAAAPAAQDDPLPAVLRSAGAVNLGKTQTSEFGLTGYAENLVAQPARSPFDPQLTAGGSSGGAAAAVATGMLPVAPGSDGGGSIRIPAACCGLVGLKPTRGFVPTDQRAESATLPLTVSGVLARSSADAKLLFQAIAPSSAPAMAADGLLRAKKLRIGVSLASPFAHDLDIRVADNYLAAVSHVAEALEALGHTVVHADIKYPPHYLRLFSTLWQSQFAQTEFSAEQLAQFTAYARYSWEAGAGIGADQRAATIAQLQVFAREVAAQWSAYDVLLTPTLAGDAKPVGCFEALAPAQNFIAQCEWSPFTSIVNVVGAPALAMPVLPAAAVDDAAPASVQLIGHKNSDFALLELAAALEAAL
ncbi:amidase [Canibacter zhoujuaniae]|uniref:amidase n=1 Tax=Canibacter zhoujuaniae TaxID=2708343 RepID=UPI00142272D4|nr:amidase [Canibacter zhoujuaniae]